MDELLAAYNGELSYLRRMAGEFARLHPRIAGRLKLSGDVVDDPHVGRLIESFAFLSARIRLKLDDEFPELTQGLLSVLYPQYLSPLPSLMIVQAQPVHDSQTRARMPAGTELDVETVAGGTCRFRTCFDTDILPLEITAARLGGQPLLAPINPLARRAEGTLRLSLRWLRPLAGRDPSPSKIRFFLRGQPHEILPLYELILGRTISVALAAGQDDPRPSLAGSDAVTPAGFAEEEAILPGDGRGFPGYRLLAEYFAYPAKFMFFDLDLGTFDEGAWRRDNFDIFLYLAAPPRDLERAVSAANFALGCTPAVNLFPLRAEPMALTPDQAHYRVIADSRQSPSVEIHSVLTVAATHADGTRQGFLPFYGLSHPADTIGQPAPSAYWAPSRRPAIDGHGGEFWLTLTDRDQAPWRGDGGVLGVDALCLNRIGSDTLAATPRLSPRRPLDSVGALGCLTAPTTTIWPALGHGQLWRLVSHLSLNHLSLTGGTTGAEALREMLRLYDFRESPETRAIIDSVVSVGSGPGMARLTQGLHSQFCRGTDVTVDFDGQRWSSAGLFLFASVLEHFLGLYCTINSFTRLTARIHGRQEGEKTWPPRAGYRRLL